MWAIEISFWKLSTTRGHFARHCLFKWIPKWRRGCYKRCLEVVEERKNGSVCVNRLSCGKTFEIQLRVKKQAWIEISGDFSQNWVIANTFSHFLSYIKHKQPNAHDPKQLSRPSARHFTLDKLSWWRCTIFKWRLINNETNFEQQLSRLAICVKSS